MTVYIDGIPYPNPPTKNTSSRDEEFITKTNEYMKLLLNINNNMKTGIELIAEERQLQQDQGNTIIADVTYNSNQDGSFPYLYPLVIGAIAILDKSANRKPEHWAESNFKKLKSKTYKEKLIVAGAFIAAEIDRLIYIEEHDSH